MARLVHRPLSRRAIPHPRPVSLGLDITTAAPDDQSELLLVAPTANGGQLIPVADPVAVQGHYDIRELHPEFAPPLVVERCEHDHIVSAGWTDEIRQAHLLDAVRKKGLRGDRRLFLASFVAES